MLLQRIALWFVSLLIAVTLFSLFLSGIGSMAVLFRITMTFALPVACLYLPFVFALKDAEERRIWTLLLSGIFIGPVSIFLWCLVLLLRGTDPHTIWLGDPLIGIVGSAVFSMIFALIVGTLTTALYVVALKALHRPSTN